MGTEVEISYPERLVAPAHGASKQRTASTTLPTTWRRALSVLSPPVLFLLLSAIFMWQPVLTGRVFLPTDLSYRYDYMWQSDTPAPDVPVAQNPTLSDVSDYYYPYADYAIKRLRSGQFPLWNPYILTGTPFFASAQAAVLDPINLLTYLAGPLDYWAWAAWLRLALLGFTTYGFMRALGRNAAAGITAGVVFMLSGFVAAWLNYSVVTVLAWLPGLLWATTRLLQTGRPAWLGLTAFTMGALLVGGHPETQFLCGLFWAAYCIYYLFATRRHKGDDRYPSARSRIPMLAGAAVLGIAIGLAQFLPTVDFMLNSNAFGSRTGSARPFSIGEMALRLIVMAVPNFTGTPVAGSYWVQPSVTNFNEQTGYIGLLALGLAVTGAASMWRRDRLVPFFAVSALLALLLGIQAPGFNFVRSLPLFNAGPGVRWLIVVSFCGAVLAGYGVEALMSYAPRSRRLRSLGLLYAAGALAVFGLLLLLYIGVSDGGWDRTWGAPTLNHAQMVRLLYPLQIMLNWPIIFLALGALAVLARWRGQLRATTLPVAIIALLYADLWTFGSRYNPVTPAAAIYPPTNTIRYLSENLGRSRMAGTINLLRPNVPMVFGLRDLRGYEDLVDAPFAKLYNNFYNQSRTPIFDVSRKRNLKLTAVEQRQLNIASVRYVVTVRKPKVAGDARPYRFILEEGRTATYENLQALPRAYVVYSSRVRPNLSGAAASLRSVRNDPARTVILDAGEEVLPGPGPDPKTVPVAWRADEPERVRLEATLPASGWLVLSDNYAPGWEAELDGAPVPMLRANVVFRAVALPSGQHTVAFYYRPRIFYVSAAVSVVALLMALALGLLDLRHRRRPVSALAT